MDPTTLSQRAGELANDAATLTRNLDQLSLEIGQIAAQAGGGGGDFVFHLTVFALACFVGYYVVWRVTPALHSPLMAVTNAVSSVIIVGALLAAGLRGLGMAQLFGGIAVALAAVNIFGGFIVTHRMLSMFKKKPVKK